MSRILLLTGNASPADRERCGGFLEFLRRRAGLVEGPLSSSVTTADSSPALSRALLRLAGLGRLSYSGTAEGAVEVFYTPSSAAARQVFEAGPEAGFPEPVQKKQAAAFRASQGALFRFPAERGEGAVEVFITDWSPCPAACAIAIHRAHPFAADLDKPEGASFTGRYVRHPLTGDLLPVWIADWVKPDFGTGAVLVNPAHDATDLAFGRAVGLPIRFALVPSNYDGSPATWPTPPLVKTGRTVRTGPYDGLTPEEAVGRYFEVLAERGLAQRHRDVQIERQRIGKLVPASAGDLLWSASRGSVLSAAAGIQGIPSELAEAALLTAALAVDPGSHPLLVCPAGEQAGDLLALRLLVHDLTGQPLVPAAVYLLQKVQESKVEAAPELFRLAALVGAPLQQVAVVKQQTVEQVQRFLKVHQELLSAATATPAAESSAPPESIGRAYGKAKAAVLEGDPAKAFGFLQQTQKQLRDLPAEGRTSSLPGYFVLAQVVADVAAPPDLAAGRIWERL